MWGPQPYLPLILSHIISRIIEAPRTPSVVGITIDRTALVTTRPLRALYHATLDVRLFGGSHVPLPGSSERSTVQMAGMTLPPHTGM